MLKQRVITALILLPLVLSLVWFAPTPYLAASLAAVIFLAAKEWSKLAGLKTIQSLFFFVAIALLLILAWWQRSHELVVNLMWIITAAWMIISLYLVMRRKSLQVLTTTSYGAMVAGLVFLPASWLALVLLHETEPTGPQLVLMVLVLIWIADTGAYFSGRAFGKHKLAPVVSPGKTWEGALGAFAGAAIYAAILLQFEFFKDQSYLHILLLCLLVTFVSIGGDLFESLVKRQRGVKDSGNLLPGHGGIYDRIDSLVSASPAFFAGLTLLGSIS